MKRRLRMDCAISVSLHGTSTTSGTQPLSCGTPLLNKIQLNMKYNQAHSTEAGSCVRAHLNKKKSVM